MSKKNHPVASPEEISNELSKVRSLDDFFGKDGALAKIVGKTMQSMLEAEMEDHLGYPKHSVKGNNSGNSRNGTYKRKIRSSAGETEIEVPRDRNGDFESRLLSEYSKSSNEIQDKTVAMYGRGMSVSDIKQTLADIYGIDVSDTLVSQMTDKILPLVEEWRERPLDEIYPIVYLDCIHIKLRKDSKVTNTAVYIALGLNLEGKKDILGIWVGEGAEGSNYWLSVLTELQERGLKKIFIVCVDNLKGFSDAIKAMYPQTDIQKCVIHQIRASLKYVSWKDSREFIKDLKKVYKAGTKRTAEKQLEELDKKWERKYPLAVRSWKNNWEEVSTYFEYPAEIRRIIYTTNILESFNRQIRKVTKAKSVFPTEQSVYKIMYLATRDVTRKWSMPVQNWANILNQLCIRFEEQINGKI